MNTTAAFTLAGIYGTIRAILDNSDLYSKAVLMAKLAEFKGEIETAIPILSALDRELGGA